MARNQSAQLEKDLEQDQDLVRMEVSETMFVGGEFGRLYPGSVVEIPRPTAQRWLRIGVAKPTNAEPTSLATDSIQYEHQLAVIQANQAIAQAEAARARALEQLEAINRGELPPSFGQHPNLMVAQQPAPEGFPDQGVRGRRTQPQALNVPPGGDPNMAPVVATGVNTPPTTPPADGDNSGNTGS